MTFTIPKNFFFQEQLRKVKVDKQPRKLCGNPLKFVPPSSQGVDLGRRKRRPQEDHHSMDGIFTLEYEEKLIREMNAIREYKKQRSLSHPPQINPSATVPLMNQPLTTARSVSVSGLTVEQPSMDVEWVIPSDPLLPNYEEAFHDAPGFDAAEYEDLLREVSSDNYHE